jgi:hypothetical protein
LAHELAEVMEYRRIWHRRPSTETYEEADSLFKSRTALAHAYGLEREEAVAHAQRTRVDHHGMPYMRTAFCNLPDKRMFRIVLGAHTETMTVAGDSIQRIEYAADRDLCQAH